MYYNIMILNIFSNYLSASPVVSSHAPTLTRITKHPIGYSAHWLVGVGQDGSILLGRRDSPTLVLYRWSHGKYSRVWEKPCPRGVTCEDRKYILGRGELRQLIFNADRGRDPTRVMRSELQPMCKHTVVTGWLCGVLPGGRCVYAGGGNLSMYRGDYHVGTLRPDGNSSHNRSSA